ncbi:hypothetical protein Tco_1072347 [Tanacetum coccineum]
MIIELFECLPVIELLSIDSDWLWFKRDRVPAKLPTAFVHLKYLCIKKVLLFDETRSENLVFVIRSSTNLENIKIEITDKNSYEGPRPVTLESCSDIWLEHLQNLEIQGLAARNGEMEFVKGYEEGKLIIELQRLHGPIVAMYSVAFIRMLQFVDMRKAKGKMKMIKRTHSKVFGKIAIVVRMRGL